MKTPSLVRTLLLLLSASFVHAQDYTGDNEEIVPLSPFEISSSTDLGYVALGKRANGDIVDPASGSALPQVPVTLLKRAEALVVTFTLFNTGEKQETRNAELYTTVEALRAAFARAEGLRLENREVRFASGNRSKLSIRSGSSTTSYASVLIYASLAPDTDVLKTVKRIRDLTVRVPLQGQTRIADGAVGLSLQRPEQYRREILTKIFADVEFLKKSLGPEFEVQLSGLNQRVRTRASSETDIELWIDYSFIIRSIREITAAAK